MHNLAQWQSDMAVGLWQGRFGPLTSEIAPGPVTATAALQVHRNTIVSGLINALRLTYPTVDWLVGEDFFDQAAGDYVRAHPPSCAQLSDYGSDFPAFLGAYALAADLAYLPDVARFDQAIDQVAGLSIETTWQALALTESIELWLDASLRLLSLTYPADRIRDAQADDGESLADLDLSPGARHYVLWAGSAGAMARDITPGLAAFLTAALDGRPAEQALDALLAQAGEAGLADLQTQIFTAPFARVQVIQPGDNP